MMKFIYIGGCAFILFRTRADVAELADALDSKSGIRKDVWVRPPPSAPSSFSSEGAGPSTGFAGKRGTVFAKNCVAFFKGWWQPEADERPGNRPGAAEYSRMRESYIP